MGDLGDGGPAELYFAISKRLRNSAHEIRVVERKRPLNILRGRSHALGVEVISA